MTTEHIKVLDMIADGDWDGAHHLIKNHQDQLASLIHGHLHREEGDLDQANYWYSRASQDIPDVTLETEFDRLYQMGTLNMPSLF